MCIRDRCVCVRARAITLCLIRLLFLKKGTSIFWGWRCVRTCSTASIFNLWLFVGLTLLIVSSVNRGLFTFFENIVFLLFVVPFLYSCSRSISISVYLLSFDFYLHCNSTAYKVAEWSFIQFREIHQSDVSAIFYHMFPNAFYTYWLSTIVFPPSFK